MRKHEQNTALDGEEGRMVVRIRDDASAGADAICPLNFPGFDAILRITMKYAAIVAAFLTATAAAAPDDRTRVTGEYVEARTAEVFAGGCIMNSEAETAGRQAVMAWRITTGRIGAVAIDGLAMAAAVAGDRNLGMRDMGGEAPHTIRAIVTIDDRARDDQRQALVGLVRELSGGLVSDIVRVDVGPVRFVTTEHVIDVRAAGDLLLTVNKHMTHDPSCGAMQWFKPFSPQLTRSAMGVAETHTYSGSALGSRWSAPNKRSAFWGTFVY
jgi:hypothetical protein